MPIESFHHLVLICLSKLGFYSTSWKPFKDKTLIFLISIFSAPTTASNRDAWKMFMNWTKAPSCSWTVVWPQMNLHHVFSSRALAHALPSPVKLTLGKRQYHWFLELEVTALISESQAYIGDVIFPCAVFMYVPPSPHLL